MNSIGCAGCAAPALYFLPVQSQLRSVWPEQKFLGTCVFMGWHAFPSGGEIFEKFNQCQIVARGHDAVANGSGNPIWLRLDRNWKMTSRGVPVRTEFDTRSKIRCNGERPSRRGILGTSSCRTISFHKRLLFGLSHRKLHSGARNFYCGLYRIFERDGETE